MFYTGKVTDKAGLPLAGVRVSDGRNVVLTDAEGRYALPGWERSRVLHVGVLTRNREDWFVCTDGKAGVYDFTLSPAPQQEDFCFLHVSDTEINGRKQLEEALPAVQRKLCDMCDETVEIAIEAGQDLEGHKNEKGDDQHGQKQHKSFLSRIFHSARLLSFFYFT